MSLCSVTTITSLSAVPLPEQGVVVFDLDDTLYPEREFVRSGFRAVASAVERETGVAAFERLIELFDRRHPDPFGAVLAEQGLVVRGSPDPTCLRLMITTYRDHEPTLTLAVEVARLLSELRSAGYELGILTDGRSRTQRGKIRALGLERWIDTIVISEEFGSAKPAERNYRHFEECFPSRQYVYVGNDPSKDFVAPNRLGWQTVCVLDDGQQVHRQDTAHVSADAVPHYWIERLA